PVYDARVSERPANRRATDRAFVVQFLTNPAGDGSAFYGRVERIASGESCRFESVDELLAFLFRGAGIMAGDDGAVKPGTEAKAQRREGGKLPPL
ncbi:MAG: hypothetical protein ACREQQ_17070, partial [Candidatus Binatia bacterium]